MAWPFKLALLAVPPNVSRVPAPGRGCVGDSHNELSAPLNSRSEDRS
jgi:hypothetical protein